MQHRSRSPIRPTARSLRRVGAIGAREWAELEAIREGSCHRTPRGGPTVGPSAAPNRPHAIRSREWAEHGASQAARRIRENDAQVTAVLSTVDQRRPTPLPNRFLLAFAEAARSHGGFEAAVAIEAAVATNRSYHEPVGEPVSPVAEAYTSQDEEYTIDDPEAAEEGFYYDAAAARRHTSDMAEAAARAEAAFTRRDTRPSSREAYLAANPLSPPRSRSERFRASGGTAGVESPVVEMCLVLGCTACPLRAAFVPPSALEAGAGADACARA